MARQSTNADHPLNRAVAAEFRSEQGRAQLKIPELVIRTGISERTLHRILNAQKDITVIELGRISYGLHVFPHDVLRKAEEAVDRGTFGEIPPAPSAERRRSV
jgi:hypothetical protein